MEYRAGTCQESLKTNGVGNAAPMASLSPKRRMSFRFSALSMRRQVRLCSDMESKSMNRELMHYFRLLL